YESLGQLGVRTQVTLVARHGDWFKVRTARGTTGWVLGEMLDVSARVARSVPVTNDVPAAPRAAAAEIQTFTGNSAASSRGAVAARVARRYVGSRYRWGGASPRGFDCSGLVVYAYRQAGLRLPHKASALYSTRYGTRIRSIGALKPGDIVAFAGTAGRKRGITHVAIYVGGGRMVTANSPRMGVRLASIHTRYWRSHFVGAIRPR
ncbi:MAG: NlpC/P60 family protein, partial [Chloroflexota bacterium]|nr:NlpC/P60 family protein [Chloroflexota bacterium]